MNGMIDMRNEELTAVADVTGSVNIVLMNLNGMDLIHQHPTLMMMDCHPWLWMTLTL